MAVVLVLAAATAAGWRWWVGPVAEVVAVQRRDAVQTVVASGHVESPHRVDIGAALTGTVQQVPVVEGQAVKAGDVLLRLDSAELRATALAAQLTLQQAQGRLRQLQEVQRPVAEQALRQAEATRDNALAQLRRQQDLARQGFIGEAALEDARKAAALAQAQARSAQTQWASLRSDGADFALAQSAVAQARAAADAAVAKADTSTVRAPVAGTLIGRNVEVGDVVQPGKVLMTLSPAGALQLVVDIDEKNLQLLALGQRALASADAFAQQRFEAVLAYIN
ncbi:MAG: efflux transporter periplasmic adaptor subunit, partial [Burkholderiales bacterium PBB5]